MPEARPEDTDTVDHPTQQQPKRKKSSLRRLTKIIHKRRTKDSVSKEKLVTAVDHGSGSDEKMPSVSETQQVIPVVCQTRLNTKDDTDEGACAKSASNAEFEVLNLAAAFASNQDESDDDSLLNSSGAVNSFYLDVAFRQPLNTSIEVLEEVHTLLTDIARINRNSQVTISTGR